MIQLKTSSCYIRDKFTETKAWASDHDCSGIGDNHRWRFVAAAWSGGRRSGGWGGLWGESGHNDGASHRCRPLADPLQNPVGSNRRALPDHPRRLSLVSSLLRAGRTKLSLPMCSSVLRVFADGERHGGRRGQMRRPVSSVVDGPKPSRPGQDVKLPPAFICLPAGFLFPPQGGSSPPMASWQDR